MILRRETAREDVMQATAILVIKLQDSEALNC